MSLAPEIADAQQASAAADEMHRHADVGELSNFLHTIRRIYPRAYILMLLSLVFVAAACRMVLDFDEVAPISLGLTPYDAAAELRARYVTGKPHFRGKSYYIALNLINNEPILPQMRSQLLLLGSALGADNIFISIYENGSKDRTKDQLKIFEYELRDAGIKYHIEANEGSWRQFCPQIVDARDRANCVRAACPILRDCPETVRIPVMAAIRNMALLPLLNVTSIGEAAPMFLSRKERAFDMASKGIAAIEDGRLGTHLGLFNPVEVVFLNDIVLYASDVLELLGTVGGDYDMACGMDFELLKFYDTWVARDISGASFSDWYPYVRENTAQEKFRLGEPFRVYACWNGMVALPASFLVMDGLLFRSWQPGESRSLNVHAAPTEIYSEYLCPASECQLICKDLWQAGHRRIWMNPRVQVYYNHKTEMLQRLLMRAANFLLLSWSNRIATPHHALRSARIPLPVGTSVQWESALYDADFERNVPIVVSCGLADDDVKAI